MAKTKEKKEELNAIREEVETSVNSIQDVENRKAEFDRINARIIQLEAEGYRLMVQAQLVDNRLVQIHQELAQLRQNR